MQTLVVHLLKEGFGYPVNTTLSISLADQRFLSILSMNDSMDIERDINLNPTQLNNLLSELGPVYRKYSSPQNPQLG